MTTTDSLAAFGKIFDGLWQWGIETYKTSGIIGIIGLVIWFLFGGALFYFAAKVNSEGFEKEKNGIQKQR